MLKYQVISGIVKVCLLTAVIFATTVICSAQEAATADEQAAVEQVAKTPLVSGHFYAVAGLMSIGCLAAAFAVGKIGTAVMGAAAEKPEVMGKAIAFVGLGEGIALFAFLVCLMLMMKM